MNFKFTFILRRIEGDTYTAPRETHPFFPLDNLVFICRECGDTWFRVESTDARLPFYPLSQRCPHCGLGSLRHPHDGKPIPDLPRELLERELFLALDHPDQYWSFNP